MKYFKITSYRRNDCVETWKIIQYNDVVLIYENSRIKDNSSFPLFTQIMECLPKQQYIYVNYILPDDLIHYKALDKEELPITFEETHKVLKERKFNKSFDDKLND